MGLLTIILANELIQIYLVTASKYINTLRLINFKTSLWLKQRLNSSSLFSQFVSKIAIKCKSF